MKKLLIAILMFLIGGTGYVATNELGWGGGGSDAYVTSIEHTTTSVSTCIRSIYHVEPTSTDLAWICATTTNQGTPWTVLEENTSRLGFECCNRTPNSSSTLWMIDRLATSTLVATTSRNSAGYRLLLNECFNTHDYGIIWGGTVYGLANATVTMACIEFK